MARSGAGLAFDPVDASFASVEKCRRDDDDGRRRARRRATTRRARADLDRVDPDLERVGRIHRTRTSLVADALTTQRTGATDLAEARRSCFTEDFAAMPPTREAMTAVGIAMAAFITTADDVSEVLVEGCDVKSRCG